MDDEQREAVRKGLRRLIESYMSQSQGYTSRRAVFSEQFPGDYDHLARFGEWEMTDSPVPTLVGAQDGT